MISSSPTCRLAGNWRHVPGHKGRYSVSDQGEVWSEITGRILKAHADREGYLRVGLWRDDRRKNEYVHRLVLRAFVCEKPHGAETAHLNGIRTDNRLVNLKWASQFENDSHKVLHGTSTRKLNEAAVREIRHARSSRSATFKQLAERFNVSKSLVRKVSANHGWRHVQ